MVAVELSKIVVVVINVIFLLFGLACLIVGIVFKVGWDDVRDAFIDLADEVDVDLKSAGDALGYGGIIFGSFIIVVSLLGCIGACCKVRVLLALYAIILLILVIGEVTIVAYVATHVDKTEEEIGKVLDKSLEGYYEDYHEDKNGDPRWKAFSAIFNKLECCGVINANKSFPYNPQYHNNTFIWSTKRDITAYPPKIPVTCCKNVDYQAELQAKIFDECFKDANNPNVYTQGCLQTIIDKIKDNKGILIGVGVAILVLELLMILLSFCLCCHRSEKGVHA